MADEDWAQAAAEVREQLDRGERPRGPAMKRLYDLALAKCRSLPSWRRMGGDNRGDEKNRDGEGLDLLADVFASRLSEIVHAEKPAGLFYVVYTSRFLDWLDRQKVRREAKPLLEEQARRRQGETYDPPEGEAAVAARELADVFAALPKKQRDVLLAVADGVTREQLAAELGTSSANVDQIVSRARKALRRLLGEGDGP